MAKEEQTLVSQAQQLYPQIKERRTQETSLAEHKIKEKIGPQPLYVGDLINQVVKETNLWFVFIWSVVWKMIEEGNLELHRDVHLKKFPHEQGKPLTSQDIAPKENPKTFLANHRSEGLPPLLRVRLMAMDSELGIRADLWHQNRTPENLAEWHVLYLEMLALGAGPFDIDAFSEIDGPYPDEE